MSKVLGTRGGEWAAGGHGYGWAVLKNIIYLHESDLMLPGVIGIKEASWNIQSSDEPWYP